MENFSATPHASLHPSVPRLRFDRTVWPYLIGRMQDTATAVEAGQLMTRLQPWLATRTDLLAMWIDDSHLPHPWFDETAVRAMTHWLIVHRDELRERCIAVAFVSRHVWKRRDLERRICGFEIAHQIAIDVFANESSARGWLRARPQSVARKR